MRSAKLFARLGKLAVGDGFPVAVIGVINLSKESFYPRSISEPDEVRERAVQMIKEGASIIDIGAMSTRPGAKVISLEEEKERILSAVRNLRDLDVVISVDTQRSEVAEIALREGAQVVNDVSGFKHDPRIAKIVRDFSASAIVMSSWVKEGELLIARSAGGEKISTMEGVIQMLRESLEIARKAEIPEENIVVDPGIGFSVGPQTSTGSEITSGSWHERDIRIIAQLDRLRELGRPICVGVSRKSFIGRILGLPDPEDRLVGSIAATVISVLRGAHVVRTHDVKETLQAVRVAEAFLRYQL